MAEPWVERKVRRTPRYLSLQPTPNTPLASQRHIANARPTAGVIRVCRI